MYLLSLQREVGAHGDESAQGGKKLKKNTKKNRSNQTPVSKNVNNFSDGQNKNILLVGNVSKLDEEDNDTSNSKIDQQEVSDHLRQSCPTEASKNLAGTEVSTK